MSIQPHESSQQHPATIDPSRIAKLRAIADDLTAWHDDAVQHLPPMMQTMGAQGCVPPMLRTLKHAAGVIAATADGLGACGDDD